MPSLKITTRCHSVFSLRSPVALSRQVSEVAMLRLAIGRPSWVRRISGSLPRFPTKITLFTLPAIAALHARNYRIVRPALAWSFQLRVLAVAAKTRIEARPYTLNERANVAIPPDAPVIHI